MNYPCKVQVSLLDVKEKSFSSTLLGSVMASLQITLTKDRLTGEEAYIFY